MCQGLRYCHRQESSYPIVFKPATTYPDELLIKPEYPMHTFCIAGWPCVGCSETLLDRICRNVKNGARRLIEILNQRGEP
ncbi:protease FtsH-inhibitory lysogeny factor CIII [Yersinia enterocolitica]